MVLKKQINSYEEFAKFIKDMKPGGPAIYFFFTGTILPETGQSWCPDCVEADPVVEHFTEKLSDDYLFVTVYVGDRETWKDKNCPFRTDRDTRLMVIPTMIKWRGVQRLEGSQCAKHDLLQMLFEDDD